MNQLSPLMASGWESGSVHWPQKVFDDFVLNYNLNAQSVNAQTHKTLSRATASLYGKFWNKFCEHLFESRGVPWHQAKEDDVKAFLGNVQPRSKREEKVKISRKSSDVTKQRYETILFKIFHFAGSQCCGAPDNPYFGLVEVNPVHLSQVEGASKREAADSFLLHANYRAKLLSAIDRHAQEWDARDAAMLSLMSNEGLTVSEISNLQCEDLVWKELEMTSLNWWMGRDTWPNAPQPGWIHIRDGGRKAQERTLELTSMSREIVQNWLKHRGEILPKSGSPYLLFGKRGQISAVRIYEIAQNHILKTLVHPENGTGDERSLAHAGPMALRNSAIMHWLETIPNIEEVRRRAGLGELKSMLRFVNTASETIKDRFKEAVKLAQVQAQESAKESGEQAIEPTGDESLF